MRTAPAWSSAAAEPELREVVPGAKLPRVARDADHLRALRALEIESYLTAPLQARGRTLGAITFAYSGSHKHYRRADLRLATELGGAGGPGGGQRAALQRLARGGAAAG